MKNEKFELSLIIPCYNEGPTFESSVDKIVNVLKKTRRKWEIIFVEDKSTDNTKKTVQKLTNKIKTAKAIFHNKNLGRGKSVTNGIKASKGKICGYIDVDLEIPATYIPIFIKEIEKGHDLVVGKRYYEGGLKSITRLVSSKVYAFTVKTILQLPIGDTEAGYKFFRKSKIIKILPKIKNKHWFWDTEICARSYWQNLEISQIPVLFKRKPEKQSTVKIIPDTIDYIKNLIRLKLEKNEKSLTK